MRAFGPTRWVRQWHERRRDDERGAIALLTALLLTTLMFSAAFVMDIGTQRVARSDVQALADVVALDLARDLDGTKTAAQLQTTLQSRADASKARNDDVVGHDVTVDPTLGTLSGSGTFTAVTGSAVPTAVRVIAHTTVDFGFASVTGVGSGSSSKRAVAVSAKGGCFAVGSYAANLDSTQSALLNPILGGLLGSTVNLQAVGYNGLASASVKLTDLVTLGGLGVGTVDELLKASVKVGDLYVAVAKVLDSQGNTAQANLLRSLAVSAGTPRIVVGNLLNAAASDQAALGASFNVLDLVTGAAYLANQGHAVAIQNLGVTIPGIATVGTATVTVIDAPQISCGGVGTTAHTAQVKLDLPLTVNAQSVTVQGVGAVALKKTDLTLTMNLGEAMATLSGVACGTSGATSMSLSVGSSLVGSMALAGTMGFKVDVNPTKTSSTNGSLFTLIQNVLGLLSTVNVSIENTTTIGATTPGTSFSKPVTISLPSEYNTKKTTGSGSLLNPMTAYVDSSSKVQVTAKLLGILNTSIKYYDSSDNTGIFNAVVNPLTTYITNTLLGQTVSGLQSSVIDPLSKLLGLSLGGADVWAIPTATCTNPALRQ